MKKIITTFCIAIILLLTQYDAAAQPNHGVTFRYLWYNYQNPEPAWQDWQDIYSDAKGRGVEIAYNCKISKNSFLVVPLKMGTAKTDGNALGRSDLLGNLDVLLQNNLFKHGNFINPFVQLGVGSTYNFDSEAFDFNIPAGLGFNIRVVPNVYINAITQYRFSIENRPGWHHGVGVTVYFGIDDRDKDGVSDEEDKCPDVPGIAALMGCPDRDGDGITDLDDRCPDVAGPMPMRGCPDRDGDTVVDIDDKCPDMAGLVAMMGCPDKDGDGIADGDDACPDEKGTLAMAGCPDSDDDGLADNKDKCPREKGPASNNGCPILDRDNDGINDADDACPDAKGPASTRGCPDRDSDGVADKDDACPDKKGDSAHKGCPDTDGDGIYDNDDRCPDRPGTLALRGCPEIKKEDKAKLERAIKLVQFESGKAVLLQKSYAVLDEVMSVMNTYPEYSLNISGHTDSQGDDKMNQALSERRAKACYEYLVKKGVDTNRVSSIGYGESKPIATNMYAAGREQNRRVVFELEVK